MFLHVLFLLSWQQIPVLLHHLVNVMLVGSNDSPRPSARRYWSATTGHYPDRNPVVFGENMRGVRNPIVRSFPSWPVRGRL